MGKIVTQTAARHIPPEHSRSWLLRSALSEESSASAACDQVVLDLEDSIEDRDKSHARATVQHLLSSGLQAWVRINNRRTRHWHLDLDSVGLLPGLIGVMLAKTESAGEVRDTFARVGYGKPIIPLIESARGVESANRIAKARGALRLAFGTGDYGRDTGIVPGPLTLAHPRSRLVIASKVANLAAPIDGPVHSRDPDVVSHESRASFESGLAGKLVLNDWQAPIINEAMSPSLVEIAWATNLLSGKSAEETPRDGSFLPQILRAERLLALAEIFSTVDSPDLR